VCGEEWEELHLALAAMAAYPLDQVLLGGRAITKEGAAGQVWLKRPDTTVHIADALGKIDDEAEYKRFGDAFNTLREFYRRAVAEKCAVLFVVDPKA
jgi:hypothetical protein